MTRFALAAGLLATAAAARSDGGYFVVRVLIESGKGESVASAPARPGGGLFPPGPGGGVGGGDGDPDDRRGSSGGQRPPGGYGPMGMGPMGYGPPGLTGGVGPRPVGATGTTLTGDPARSIFVVVPYTKRPGYTRAFYPKRGEHPQYNPSWAVRAIHPFGQTNLFVDDSTVQVYTNLGQGLPPVNKTRESILLDRYARWAKDSADAQVLLDYLFEGLEYGLVGDAVRMADDLLAAVQTGKAKNVTPPVGVFAKAYAAVQKPLKDLPTQRGDGDRWVNTLAAALPGAQHVTRGHYTLVYWKETGEVERNRRLAQLEDNFRAFYLWHAARGQVLPFPDKPFLAVLPLTGDDTLGKFGTVLDRTPIVADGFYAPEYDLLFLSPERLDEVGRTFQRQIKQLDQIGVSRDALLAGEGPRLDTTGAMANTKRPDEVARLMTYAMVEKYAGEANEWGAVSREGGRQLFYATGLLPRHVDLPSWLTNGAVGFWTRPRGVVLSTRGEGEGEKTYATIGLTTGFGGPNYVRQKQFLDLVAKKQLNTDEGATLRNVVNDAYFAASVERVDADNPRLPLPPARKRPAAPPGGLPGPFGGGVGGGEAVPPPPDPIVLERQKVDFLNTKKYATAWALYYYLAKFQPDGLRRYVAELSAMPRDLPFDEANQLEVFARAFNLTTGPTRDGDKLTFTDFGKKWLQAMNNLPPAGVEFELREPAPTPAATNQGAGAFGPPAGGGAGGGAPGNGGE